MRTTLGLTAALVSALAITACSDPVSPKAAVDGPSFASGHVTIDAAMLTFSSGAGNTTYCGFSGQDLFNTPTSCELADPDAMVTSLNPGWAAYMAHDDFQAAAWIGPVANSDAYVNAPGTYTYERTFEIPPGTTNLELNLEILADNNMTVLVNGQNIGTQPQLDNFFTTPQPFNATTELTTGTNTITFIVNNTRVDGTPVGQPCANPPAIYAVADYDNVLCYNPTGFLYSAVVGWELEQEEDPAYWCSPGYWKNAQDAAWANIEGGIAVRNTLYNGIPLTPAVAGDPTIWTVLQNPNVYKGPATNAVANYLADLAGWSGTQSSNIGCPLNNHGAFVGVED